MIGLSLIFWIVGLLGLAGVWVGFKRSHTITQTGGSAGGLVGHMMGGTISNSSVSNSKIRGGNAMTSVSNQTTTLFSLSVGVSIVSFSIAVNLVMQWALASPA